MTDLLVEVFPEGPQADAIVVVGHPVAASASPLPGPVTSAVTPAPAPLVATVVHVPHGIVATASGAEGVELIVHPRP